MEHICRINLDKEYLNENDVKGLQDDRRSLKLLVLGICVH